MDHELRLLLIVLVLGLSLWFGPNWLRVVLPRNSLLLVTRPLWSKLRLLWFLPAAKDGAHLHVQVWYGFKIMCHIISCLAWRTRRTPSTLAWPTAGCSPSTSTRLILTSLLPDFMTAMLPSTICAGWYLQRWKSALYYSLQWREQHDQQAKPHVKRKQWKAQRACLASLLF